MASSSGTTDELFSGRLGFDLIKTFKVYPSLFGLTINDDAAELSSRMNDHPRVYIFMRRQPRTPLMPTTCH